MENIEHPTSNTERPRQLLVEQDDAVGVGAFEIVVNAPAIGGFGEFLVVDDDEFGF
jgi:hypothetical protein